MGKVQARTSLWYLVFVGFAVNYMIRINLNITIVDMVKNRNKFHSLSTMNNHRKYAKECSNDVSPSSATDSSFESSTNVMLFILVNNSMNQFSNNNEKNSEKNGDSNKNRIKIFNSDNKMNKIINSEASDHGLVKGIINSNSMIDISRNSIDDDDEDLVNLISSTTMKVVGENLKNYHDSANINEIDERLRNDVVMHTTRTFSPERVILDAFDIKYEQNGFNWDEYEQGLVLGSFFWLHWLTQIPGGILAKKYGTKLIYGLSNAIGCWICFLLPFVSYLDYRILIIFRVIQGLICGLAWPAMHNMTAEWIPPNERSKFVTAYLGSSIGIAIFYPLFGYIMSWASWEWVYHLCGIIGTTWYILWLFMVYDTPAKHPRISDEERKYIEKSLNENNSNNSKNNNSNIKLIPWKDILTSKSVWMNVIAQWGGIWGLFTLMTQAPTYFKIIHGWNIKMTGILSGVPHFMRVVFAYFFSMFGDYLLRTKKMSRTNVRKMATTICCIVNGIFVFALAFSGCDSIVAIIFLTLATAVHGAVSTGPLASIVDIAPNYAGIILGLSGMIGVLPGFISPVIVGILTYENQTITSWKYVFLIASFMLIVSGVLYVISCDSSTQPWNDIQRSNVENKNQEINLVLIKDEKIDQNTNKVIIENCNEKSNKDENNEDGYCTLLNNVEK